MPMKGYVIKMRIIGGKAKGTKLYALKGDTTRPTLDRVKESVFNIIQNDVYDSTFLDLFSGSGAIGLEAASRGAMFVIMCEKDKNAIQIIKKNIEKTHLNEKVFLYETSFQILLKNINKKFDIVYLDPPYITDYAYQSTKMILENKLLNKNGMIIIETDDDKKIKEQIKDLNIEIVNEKKYGHIHLIFLKNIYNEK